MVKRLNLADLQQQIGELTEALQRERADSVNLRRRVEEEKMQAGNFYKAMVVRDILPIIDNCERLLDHISAHSKDGPLRGGAEKIVQQAQKVLADLGVERTKTVGEYFDPHLHKAVHLDDGDGEHDVIVEELQPGYRLGDEVIRHAIVKVKKEK